jgi:hypothetical protein
MKRTHEAEGAIYVRPQGRRFVVTVETQQADGDPPRSFTDKRKAWGWACGLRMLRRLPIKDETGVKA